jgi:hypothetical protein
VRQGARKGSQDGISSSKKIRGCLGERSHSQSAEGSPRRKIITEATASLPYFQFPWWWRLDLFACFHSFLTVFLKGHVHTPHTTHHIQAKGVPVPLLAGQTSSGSRSSNTEPVSRIALPCRARPLPPASTLLLPPITTSPACPFEARLPVHGVVAAGLERPHPVQQTAALVYSL